MHPPYRGVAFLLSLGTLPIACGKDKDPSDPADTGNGPAPASEGEESTAGVGTTAADPTSGGPVGTTSGSTSTTGVDPGTEPQATTFLTNNPQTSDSGDTVDTFFPDFGPPMNPVCQAYVDHVLECYPRYRDYAGYLGYGCDYTIMSGLRADGPACADAIEAAFACFNAAPCEDLEPDDPDPCTAEQEAVDAACPSLAPRPPDTDTDTDTGDT